MYVGKKIKALRVELGLMQEDFANELKISQSYYSSIERGKKKISDKLKSDIIKKYGLLNDYFVGGENIIKGRVLKNNLGGKNVGGNEGVTENNSTDNGILKKYSFTEGNINENAPKIVEFINTYRAKNSDYDKFFKLCYLNNQFKDWVLDYINEINDTLILPNGFYHSEKLSYNDFEKQTKLQFDKYQPFVKNIERIKELYSFIAQEALQLKSLFKDFNEIETTTFIEQCTGKELNEAKSDYKSKIEPLL
jgi:DNA-binding XRE family transcriptional regulator